MTYADDFLANYEARIASGALTPDAAQAAAAQAFAALYTALRGASRPHAKAETHSAHGKHQRKPPIKHLARWIAASPLRPVRHKKTAQRGLYLWGDVGRGKSMLMDLFVASISQHLPTRRAHFHAFMLDIHRRLFAFRRVSGSSDPLPKVVAEIAAECRVLCLDELQVHDVADAMILSRLFLGLMEAGICVLFTSNRPPEELYQGGLQREQFEGFIRLLVTALPIVHLASATDYRLAQHRALAQHYYYPRNAAADDYLLQVWAFLTDNAPSEPLKIDVQGRVLRVDKHAQGVAWLTFAELCLRPLGANDYLALIASCHTLLLQGIPALTTEERNEAKRFVTLIDTLYDHRIKLYATAETPPEGIYAAGDGHFEFARTVSRLIEMQSDTYAALPIQRGA